LGLRRSSGSSGRSGCRWRGCLRPTQLTFDRGLGVFRAVISASPRADLALAAGARMKLTHLGIFGFAVMSQPDLRAALGFVAKYRPPSSPLIGLRLIEESGACLFVFGPIEGLAASDPIYPRVLDFNIAMFVSLIEDRLGTRAPIRRIHLSQRADAISRKVVPALGLPVVSASDQDAIELSGEALHQPLARSSPHAAATAQRLCENAMSEEDAGSPLVRAIRALLFTYAEKPTTAAFVAEHLGRSERGLRRQLAEEGTSFRDLKLSFQNRLARRYLAQTGMTVQDVALATGYSDVANFRRAFLRANGVGPKRFREEAKG